MTGDSISLYIHWPYCRSKCPYCAFNSYPRSEFDALSWARGCLQEMEYYASMTPGRALKTVYFGGGTPSLMPPDIAASLIERAGKYWSFADDIEITIEANPNAAMIEKFIGFRDAGVNRLSLGVQALDAGSLEFLGRTHTLEEALKALDRAGSVFESFSFDLIYARPGQGMESWKNELEHAIALAQGHLSLYQLTLEKGTSFYIRAGRGEFEMPGEGISAAMYELTQEVLEKAGYNGYEVSNYALPGHEGRHNLAYWRYGDYVGTGPGAHGRITTTDNEKISTRALSVPEKWLEQVESSGHGSKPFESLSPSDRAAEALLMGLRLSEGVPFSRIEAESGQIWSKTVDPGKLREMRDAGLLYDDAKTLRATPAGRLRLDALTGRLLA